MSSSSLSIPTARRSRPTARRFGSRSDQSSHAGARHRRQSRDRPQRRARGRAAPARGRRRRRDGVRHGRDGRRHRHRLGAGDRASGARGRRAHGRRGDQAVSVRGQSRRMKQAESGAARSQGSSRYADHDSQSAPALDRQPHHLDARRVQERRRCAAAGRTRNLGAGHRARPDQSRLRRRAHDHGRARDGDDGLGECLGRKSRAGSGATRNFEPAARGRIDQGRARPAGQYHRQPRDGAATRSTRRSA